MTLDFKSGDYVLYKSRKNGGKYVGVFARAWFDSSGRCCAVIMSAKYPMVEVANPFIEDVELLTDEKHMLMKLEND